MSPTHVPLVVVGDLVWDMVVRTDTVLLPGGDVTGAIALYPGGSAANVAVWAARCGLASAFVGAVGIDLLGRILADDLAAEGVAAHLVSLSTRPTAVLLALVDPDGQRSFVTSQGADFLLEPTQLPAVIDATRHVHLTAWSLFTDPPAAAALTAARRARGAGATLSVDPASHQMIADYGTARFLNLLDELHPDLLVPNRDEGAILSGATEPQAIVAALRARFPGALIVLKLDAQGCLIGSGSAQIAVPAAPAKVVDTTGAGDSFCGAFLATYLRGGDLEKAAQHAVRVAAWVVGRAGARPPREYAGQFADTDSQEGLG